MSPPRRPGPPPVDLFADLRAEYAASLPPLVAELGALLDVAPTDPAANKVLIEEPKTAAPAAN